MKNLFFLFCLLAIGFISSCKKGESEQPDAKLVGKWKLTATVASPGGPGVWYDVPSGQNTYLEFKANGTLAGDDLASYYATYVIKDSITLTFTPKNSAVVQDYLYHIKGNVLTLSPWHLCYEECGSRYIKR